MVVQGERESPLKSERGSAHAELVEAWVGFQRAAEAAVLPHGNACFRSFALSHLKWSIPVRIPATRIWTRSPKRPRKGRDRLRRYGLCFAHRLFHAFALVPLKSKPGLSAPRPTTLQHCTDLIPDTKCRGVEGDRRHCRAAARRVLSHNDACPLCLVHSRIRAAKPLIQ
jgi:hypothetical protein